MPLLLWWVRHHHRGDADDFILWPSHVCLHWTGLCRVVWRRVTRAFHFLRGVDFFRSISARDLTLTGVYVFTDPPQDVFLPPPTQGACNVCGVGCHAWDRTGFIDGWSTRVTYQAQGAAASHVCVATWVRPECRVFMKLGSQSDQPFGLLYASTQTFHIMSPLSTPSPPPPTMLERTSTTVSKLTQYKPHLGTLHRQNISYPPIVWSACGSPDTRPYHAH